MNSRLVPAWASSDSLDDTPPAWSATSPDHTCTRSSLNPMVATLARNESAPFSDYIQERPAGETAPCGLYAAAPSSSAGPGRWVLASGACERPGGEGPGRSHAPLAGARASLFGSA